LAYVYLSDPKMLNEEIVKAGYANLIPYPPNVKYQERFIKTPVAKDNGTEIVHPVGLFLNYCF